MTAVAAKRTIYYDSVVPKLGRFCGVSTVKPNLPNNCHLALRIIYC